MNKLLNIKQAAEILGISTDTLRRWDESGKLKSIRVKRGKYEYRYYSEGVLAQHLKNSDIFKLARRWALSSDPGIPLSFFYCQNISVFNGRLSKLESELSQKPEFRKNYSLLVMMAGEIGNNSFDHNLGNWPDVMGIFFAYNLDRRLIVLADRGQGILKTLSRAKPDLESHEQALKSAFTEFISGRVPERRGNGLKLVRRIIMKNNYRLFFQTGNAYFDLRGGDTELKIKAGADTIPGCLAKIEF